MTFCRLCVCITLLCWIAGCGSGSGGSGAQRDPPARLIISSPPPTLAVGGSTVLEAQVFDSAGKPIQPAPGSLTWTSSQPGVVSVDTTGKAVGLLGGSSTVTAAYTGLKGVATVVVTVTGDPRDAGLLTWQRSAIPILSPGRTFGCVVWDPDRDLWRAFAQRAKNDGTDTIVTSTSPDGAVWTTEVVVLAPAAAGAWDAGPVGVPFAWYEPGQSRPWRMLYRGKLSATEGVYEIGLVTSVDGLTWDRKGPLGNDLSAPVLPVGASGTWDRTALDFGSVIKVGGTYYLYYDTIGTPRRVGLATSTDLVSWTRDPQNPIYTGSTGPDLANAAPVPTMGRFCPDIVRWDRADGSTRYVMFVPHYSADQLTTSLEVYTCATPVFHRTDRAYVDVVTITGDTTPTKFDTPHIVCDGADRNVGTSARTGRLVWSCVATAEKSWNTELINHDRSAK